MSSTQISDLYSPDHLPVTRWRKSAQFRWICLFTQDSTREIYIPNDNQEAGLQTYTLIFSLEVKMVEILTDLNWK